LAGFCQQKNWLIAKNTYHIFVGGYMHLTMLEQIPQIYEGIS